MGRVLELYGLGHGHGIGVLDSASAEVTVSYVRNLVLPRSRPVPSRQYHSFVESFAGWSRAFQLLVEEDRALMSKAIISIPEDAKVFIVEDDPARTDWFYSRLGDRIVGVYKDPKTAIEILQCMDFSTITAFFLDHDLGGPYSPPYATDIAEYMVSRDAGVGSRTVIHSMNEPGARNLQRILPGSVYFPFGFFDIKDQPERT